MSKATEFDIGDQVYCLNGEGMPVQGTVRKLYSNQGIVWLSVDVTDAYQDRYNPEDYLPVALFSSDCYRTLDELIDKQIEHLKAQINYWEELRRKLIR